MGEVKSIEQHKDNKTLDALDRLEEHALEENRNGFASAMFLLSMSDGETFKADLEALVNTDREIFEDMITVLRYYNEGNKGLESIWPGPELLEIYEKWTEQIREEDYIQARQENTYRNH